MRQVSRFPLVGDRFSMELDAAMVVLSVDQPGGLPESQVWISVEHDPDAPQTFFFDFIVRLPGDAIPQGVTGNNAQHQATWVQTVEGGEVVRHLYRVVP